MSAVYIGPIFDQLSSNSILKYSFCCYNNFRQEVNSQRDQFLSKKHDENAARPE